ncbi:MAG: hypothetical protein IPK81_18655 [Rhodospirillales bacterium]|nr:hypothetical protein [Rhodospirillales bacterium]QQS11570.1 MAG: hypothetical protein IPK81_18655 [Rhodospirillales bacterium]
MPRLHRPTSIGLTRGERATLARLRTPERIQDFVAALPTNFEEDGDTSLSVRETLRRGHAHCIEGAFVAACALWLAGHPPLLMDMQADGDDDHVVALFRRGGHWGAISKSNHIWLRWRDPIHRTLRELALTYFHEYVGGARKTFRRYSRPFDLRRVDPRLWVTNAEDCWEAAEALDASRHYPIITAAQARGLRPRDALELKAGKMLEFAAPDARAAKRY